MEKVKNVISFDTKPLNHQNTVNNLKNIKQYFTEITDYLITEQGKNRKDQLEKEYVLELQQFVNFW